MKNKKTNFIFFFLFLSFFSKAQIGGTGVYEFMNLTNSAKISALGGTNISIYNNDLNFAFQNPALLNSDMHNRFVSNFTLYYAGIHYGQVGYARNIGKYGNIGGGIQFINYGDFIAADETGVINGKFYAAEYAFNIIWSKVINEKFSFGVNLKPIYSHLEQYKSFGIAGDIGITYFNKKTDFASSFMIKNIGTQITAYHDNNYEPVSFDVLIGVSKKLAHAPFRVNLTIHHLHKWNLTYSLPKTNTSLIPFNETEQESGNGVKFLNFLENGFRHINLGVEFLPFKGFYFAIGYDHQRRQEMKIIDKGGFVGFSWGFGIDLKRFGVSYGRSSYHLAGGTNSFSLYLNFNEFTKKETGKSTIELK